MCSGWRALRPGWRGASSIGARHARGRVRPEGRHGPNNRRISLIVRGIRSRVPAGDPLFERRGAGSSGRQPQSSTKLCRYQAGVRTHLEWSSPVSFLVVRKRSSIAQNAVNPADHSSTSDCTLDQLPQRSRSQTLVAVPKTEPPHPSRRRSRRTMTRCSSTAAPPPPRGRGDDGPLNRYLPRYIPACAAAGPAACSSPTQCGFAHFSARQIEGAHQCRCGSCSPRRTPTPLKVPCEFLARRRRSRPSSGAGSRRTGARRTAPKN